MQEIIDFMVDADDFEQALERRPRDKEEFEAFVHCCKRAIYRDWNFMLEEIGRRFVSDE